MDFLFDALPMYLYYACIGAYIVSFLYLSNIGVYFEPWWHWSFVHLSVWLSVFFFHSCVCNDTTWHDLTWPDLSWFDLVWFRFPFSCKIPYASCPLLPFGRCALTYGVYSVHTSMLTECFGTIKQQYIGIVVRDVMCVRTVSLPAGGRNVLYERGGKRWG